MARHGRWWALCLLAPLMLSGCRDSYLAVRQQNQQFTQQLTETQNAYRQLALEYRGLAQKNNDLQLYLADQGTQLQASAADMQRLRTELRDATTKLAATEQRLAERDRQVAVYTASQERRGSDIQIKPNNSLQQELPTFGVEGVKAVRDGDLVRVALPKERFFDHNNRLTDRGRQQLAIIAHTLLDTYTYHMFAIEGHVKPATSVGYVATSDHWRSMELASQVFDAVTGREPGKLPARQVNVLGCGSNFAGRITSDCQVDIVVYPERMP